MIPLPIMLLTIENEDDRAFMRGVYVDHLRVMRAQAYRILHESGEVDDVVNEACVRLIGKISLLRTLDCHMLKAYVVSTVRNTAINRIAKRDRQRAHFYLAGDEALENIASEAEDAGEAMIRREEIERVKQAIEKLTKRERAALTMKYFDELDDAQIARTMGIGVDTVRSHLMRARRHMRELMK